MLVTGRELEFEFFLEDISTVTGPCPDEPPGIFPHHLPPQTVLSSMDEAGHPCWTVGHLLITLSHKISDVIGKEEIDLQTHHGGADAKTCGGVHGAGCTVYVRGRYRVTPLNEETLRIAQSKKNNHHTSGEPCKYKLLHGVTGLAFKKNFF